MLFIFSLFLKFIFAFDEFIPKVCPGCYFSLSETISHLLLLHPILPHRRLYISSEFSCLYLMFNLQYYPFILYLLFNRRRPICAA